MYVLDGLDLNRLGGARSWRRRRGSWARRRAGWFGGTEVGLVCGLRGGEEECCCWSSDWTLLRWF